MNRIDAEKIIKEYLKPIFGFALKRCKNEHDAQDLSQDIVLKSFRALLVKDDIGDISKFIWTVAHNTLNNYYRDSAKSIICVSVDEVSDIIADPDSIFIEDDDADIIRRLQSEIAYLSKLQRKIVIAYYFENRKQVDIAKDFDIPLGTVKWHLFEAKRELKRGMDTMRKTSELKFNPIKFGSIGISGSIGTKSCDEFFRSSLSQNVCYCVRNEAKTVNEIADSLGVSPVYVETEVDFLEEYGFLKQTGNKYIVNFIISEPTEELFIIQDKMYKKASDLFANELYDELMNNGILDDENIFCNQMLSGSTINTPLRDKNFLLWSLIPYIAAMSGKKLIDNTITFEEVATIRPDGGHNIAYASVVPNDLKLPKDCLLMKDWCGPLYNADSRYTLWKIDTEWSGRRISVNQFEQESAKRVLSLYEHEEEYLLSKEDYAWLSKLGYIKTWGDYDGLFKTAWQVVVLKNKQIQEKLLSIGEKIKEKYKKTFDSIKAPYVEAVMKTVPAHLKKIKAYELQYVFHADGWFLFHCIVTLLNNGKLKLPKEEQKKSLTTIILSNT